MHYLYGIMRYIMNIEKDIIQPSEAESVLSMQLRHRELLQESPVMEKYILKRFLMVTNNLYRMDIRLCLVQSTMVYVFYS